VDISVETYRNEKALIVLRRELVQTETGPAVFVVDDDTALMPQARRVAVQTGEEKGLRLEITGGLSEGDIIVSEGVNQINEETRLNIVPAILPTGY